MENRRARFGWLAVSLALVSLGAGGADSRLADAARAGNRAGVDDLLRTGATVDAPGPDGTTALHWAV